MEEIIMSEDTWSVDNWNDVSSSEANGSGVIINGSFIGVEPGSSFRDAIKNVSLDAGFGKYRVFLNGIEIKPSEAPDVFGASDKVEVRPYDNAGQ
jgi:hypothetical protein